MKKKLIFRLFAPVLILLLSGYGTALVGNFDGPFKSFAFDTNLNANDRQFFQQNGAGLLTIKKDQPLSNKKNIKLRATDNEVDEDEVDTSDSPLTSNNYFATFYQSVSFGDYLVNFKEKANFKTVFYNLTTYKKYVLFQVFRI
ncbi:hypothetical protein [Flavobacterium ovatum]|uniref:hypothetical protein n=1 Tax=Flavobacterium ovatum TaxID=1928857 RepID=UPI00344EC13F